MIEQYLLYYIQGLATMFIAVMAYLFVTENKVRLKKVTGYVLCLWTFQMLKDIIYIFDIRDTSFTYLIELFDMFSVPCCAFVIIEIFNPKFVTSSFIVKCELPYLIFFFTFAIWPYPFIFYAALIYSLLFGTVVAVYIYRWGLRYRAIIRDNYSDLANIDILWMKKSFIIFIIFLLIWIFISIRDTPLFDIFYYFISCILWADLCYHINKQESLPLELWHDIHSDKIRTNDNKDYAFGEIMHQRIMEQSLFMNAQLSLTDLANSVGTNRTYLSDYLNNCMHINFYDYINSFRLEKALHLLADNQENNFTIERIAEDCGFNSISTFRRAFSRTYHCTPKQYVKQQKTANKQLLMTTFVLLNYNLFQCFF